MLIEQIIEFEVKEPGPPGRTCTYTTGYFHDMIKQKSLRNIVEWIILLLLLKYCKRQSTLLSPTLGQITYKIQPQSASF